MSYDFLGTFNRSQFERFLAFARSQLPTIPARMLHIDAELSRIGVLVFRFDSNRIPNAVSVDPPGSYLGKLLAAYEVLGGNPFYDLRSRSRGQAVYVLRGSEDSPAAYMSNGEPLPTKGLRDAYSAELIHRLRRDLQDVLDYRFEFLERKIRRALDTYDQLSQEKSRLQVLQSAATVTGSLEEIAVKIQQLFGDQNYRAIYDDASSDPMGINSYAPFSQYDVEASIDPAVGGPERRAELPRRQDTGFIGPGSSEGTGQNS